MIKEVRRPWGDFKQFAFNEKCTVKILSVKANEELSLQKHKHRKEIWYFLTNGYCQIGKKRKKIKEGRVVVIGKGIAHRLFAGSSPVKILEVSLGKFSEKDEIKLEDKYGRK